MDGSEEQQSSTLRLVISSAVVVLGVVFWPDRGDAAVASGVLGSGLQVVAAAAAITLAQELWLRVPPSPWRWRIGVAVLATALFLPWSFLEQSPLLLVLVLTPAMAGAAERLRASSAAFAGVAGVLLAGAAGGGVGFAMAWPTAIAVFLAVGFLAAHHVRDGLRAPVIPPPPTSPPTPPPAT